MDNFVYNIFDSYFKTLDKTGYIKQSSVNSLLILNFFYNMMYRDYRGYISEEDYHTLDKALNCLYGTNCLIPYPYYLKMGKLHLGEMTEVLSRTKVLEDYTGELDKRILDNDVLIADNTRRIDEHGTRLDEYDALLVNHEERISKNERDITEHTNRLDTIDSRLDVHDNRLDTHDGRLDTIDSSLDTIENILDTHGADINMLKREKVIKKNRTIKDIPDIVIP